MLIKLFPRFGASEYTSLSSLFSDIPARGAYLSPKQLSFFALSYVSSLQSYIHILVNDRKSGALKPTEQLLVFACSVNLVHDRLSLS